MQLVSNQTARIFSAFFKKGFLVFFIISIFLSLTNQASAVELDPNAEYCQSATTNSMGGLDLPTITSPVNGKCANSTDTLIKGSAIKDPQPTQDASSQFGYWLAQIVYIFTVGLGSVIAALAANILNFIVAIALDSKIYNLDFISNGWTIVRDLANMAFIFILVYIAIQVMFQAQTHGVMQRLVKVLAVALIINFSFFATRVVIDAGNLVSVQFYNAIVGNAAPGQISINVPFFGNIGTSTGVPDLTASIMSGVNFVSALSPESFSAATGGGNPVENFITSLITFSFVYIVFGAALFMLAAAFITAGVKFIVRIAMLWFAIITAPLALLAWSFSGGHGGHGGGGHGASGLLSFSGWLRNLLNHAFYPAVFLFVLLLISNFMAGLSTAGGFGSTGIQGTSIQDIVANLANIGVRLGFVLVMLFYALKADNYIHVAGSTVASQIGNSFTFGGLSGYTSRLSRMGGAVVTQTVGRASYVASQNLKNSGSLYGRVDSPLNRLARNKVLEPLTKAGTGGAKSYSDVIKGKKDAEKERKEIQRDVDNHHDVEHLASMQPQLDAIKAKEAAGTTLTPAEQTTKTEGAALAANIKKFNKREIEHLKADDIKRIVQHVTESQLKTLKDSDHFSDNDKREFEDKWHTSSSDAPLEKMDKEIILLRKIHENLKSSGMNMSKLANGMSKIGATSAPSAAGTQITGSDATAIQGEMRSQIAQLRSDIKSKPSGVSTVTEQMQLDNLQEGIKNLDKFKEHGGKVPAGKQYLTR